MEALCRHSHIKVSEEKGAGKRLDIFLKEAFSQFSRSYFQKLISQGNITVNGRREKPSYLLKAGDVIDVSFPLSKEIIPVPEPIPLDIIFEDDAIIVINKPAGMIVHPVRSGQKGTIVNALLHYSSRLSSVGGPLRPGIVHRLDKDTSGLMVVAKDDLTHIALSMQFKKREVKKKYLALVRGVPSQKEGIIDFKIGRHKRLWGKMEKNGKLAREAVTCYKILKSWGKWGLLELSPLTGRTHQIRVHLKSIGCFLIGDKLYGGKMGKDFPFPVSRTMLHAKFLSFFHPKRGEWMEFEVPLPKDMQGAIKYLEKNFEVRG